MAGVDNYTHLTLGPCGTGHERPRLLSADTIVLVNHGFLSNHNMIQTCLLPYQCIFMRLPGLLHEYRDLFIDKAVRNNRSKLAIANRHQER